MAGRKKKAKELTVPQLKAYIDSIFDFNGADFVPDKAQWKKIVEIIENLKEPEPIVQQMQPQYQPYPGGSGQAPMQHQQPTIVESSLDGAPKQEVPIHERTDMRKQQVRQGAAKVAEGGQVPSSGVTIVTPNKEEGDTTSDFK